jgi:hypothetical protein
VVPRRGLEPPRIAPLVPETSASTSSATWARWVPYARRRNVRTAPVLVNERRRSLVRADNERSPWSCSTSSRAGITACRCFEIAGCSRHPERPSHERHRTGIRGALPCAFRTPPGPSGREWQGTAAPICARRLAKLITCRRKQPAFPSLGTPRFAHPPQGGNSM